MPWLLPLRHKVGPLTEDIRWSPGDLGSEMASPCLSGQKYPGISLDSCFSLNPTTPQFYLQNTSQVCPSLSMSTASPLGQARLLNSLLHGLSPSPLGLWHTGSYPPSSFSSSWGTGNMAAHSGTAFPRVPCSSAGHVTLHLPAKWEWKRCVQIFYHLFKRKWLARVSSPTPFLWDRMQTRS